MIPEKVRVGACDWSVTLDDKIMQEEAAGMCDRLAHKIMVATGQAPDVEEESFLHEVLHACTNFVGLDDNKKYTEEEFVSRLSPILHSVLRDNNSWGWKNSRP